jgi:hypothetical protein
MGRITTVLYVAAAVLLAVALPLRLAPTPARAARTPAVQRATVGTSLGAAAGEPSGVTEAIVQGNVFSTSRAAPRTRYTPPDLASARPARPATRPAPPSRLRLFGTVVGPSAVALIDADPAIGGAEVYRVGDVVGGSRIVAVSESTVVLEGVAGRTVLRLQTAPSPAP